jgi:hypothetical protein
MTKTILVSLAVLTLSTSIAMAAQQRTHHRHATNASTAVPASPVASPVFGTGGVWPGGVSSADHAMYIKNQQDSGLARGR